jgi:phage/plasmid-like protein (TIGR03299 family)
MAHEIETNLNGTANAFFVGEPAWHRLGKVFPEGTELTIPDAIVAAGLDWKVRLQPLHMSYDGEDLPVPGYATVRETDRSVLGVVGPTYKPLQNADAFNWFQPFLDMGAASLEAAGSLRQGRRVWVLAKIKGLEADVVPGDPVLSYILLSNGHDGTMAIRAGMTNTRVVCANTLAMAHKDAGSKLFRIRHTAKSTEALAVIQETMGHLTGEFNATIEQYRALSRCGVVKADIEKFVRRVFNPKVIEGGANAEETDSCERLMPKIIRLFEEGAGNNLPGVRGTAWGLYNAATDFLTHERGSSEDNRLNSLWFGDSLRVNARALQTALLMAA